MQSPPRWFIRLAENRKEGGLGRESSMGRADRAAASWSCPQRTKCGQTNLKTEKKNCMFPSQCFLPNKLPLAD